jgi:hypothetical protein
MSLIHATDIQAFEARHLQANPWVVVPPQKKSPQENPPQEN